MDPSSIRFGRASVDGASDSAKVTFTVHKEAPAAMRMLLLPSLRQAGFQRCEIVVDSALENEPDTGDEPGADENDESGNAGPDAIPAAGDPAHSASADAATRPTPATPPPPLDPGSNAPATVPPSSPPPSNAAPASVGRDGVEAARARLTQLGLRARAAGLPPLHVRPDGGLPGGTAVFAGRDGGSDVPLRSARTVAGSARERPWQIPGI